ncbi:MAG: type II secretion system F family protein [Candidatus Omnitrophota bacterium]|nr:MAG: type II secretion system F family protein [Candidatus Omnitrophota bacterium]
MAKFRYTVRNQEGELNQGVIEAFSEEDAVNKLQAHNLLVTSITPLEEEVGEKKEKKRRFHSRVKIDDLILFSRQLSTLLNAGIPLLRSLEILIKQVESRRLYNALEKIKADVEAGMSFHSALSKHKRIFSDFWINLVETGEASGQLASVLGQVANYMESTGSLQRKIKSALVYPIIICIVAVVAVLVFLLKIIPTFQEIFKGFNIELPMLTKMVMKTSEILRSYFLLFAGIVVILGFALKKYIQTPRGRWQFDAFKLKLPLLGPLFQEIAVSRFASGLSTLIKAGVPLLHCLSIVSHTTGNKLFEQAITQVRESVQEGKPMAPPLEQTGLFPPMVSQMVTVGEESGELAEMLKRVSDFYEERVSASVSRLTSAFEPLMLVMMGVIVGTLIISMYLPIFKMSRIGG